MNTKKINGNEEDQKGKLKQKDAKLTNNDMLIVKSKKEEILDKLQIVLGISKEVLPKLIEKL